MMLKWFFSRTVRQAGALLKHVEKLLHHQRDILAPKAIEEVESALRETRETIATGADKDTLLKQMDGLEQAANKWLKPYPNAAWRENIEVLLVALAVAMGVRTFFLQPFKIPTGSMQPTLFGITSNPDFKATEDFPASLQPRPDFQIPNPLERLVQFWIDGISYDHVVAGSDGALVGAERARHFLIFTLWQRFRVGNEGYRVWFPPDDLLERAALVKFGHPNPRVFKAGEDIMKMKVFAGDHLFVDRMTYNFRPPKRGEIIVFETRGIQGLPQDQFYIKRLIGLPDDRVQIGDDRHLIINGKRLDASTPHFDRVLSFDSRQPPRDSQYSGYVNQKAAAEYLPPGRVLPMPLFLDQSAVYQVAPDHLLVMGDNTMNSLDSRYWGDFPAGNVIGRACFVYWPLSRRFGWFCMFH
jgi:signal peptidase I